MEYIVHLTNRCNLRCKYCYQQKQEKDISFENIKKLIDYDLSCNEKNSIINFYGGEPLIRKDLIKDTINYINEKRGNREFYYAMTTNGTLLDDEFIDYMKENNFVNICFSIDGNETAYNLNRVTIDDHKVFDIVEKNAKKLLKNFDNVTANIVITKNNLPYLCDSLKYLIDLGFKNFYYLFNHLYDWQSEDLPEIRKQYSGIADIYADKIMNEENINIIMFDNKIKSYVQKDYNCNNNCKLGMKNINVGTDGNFYPCMQFVNDENYIIGNCQNGIDFEARDKLISNAFKEIDTCKKCKINKRCKHTCACVNYLLTNDINKLSPVICETERILIDVADKMAEKLYNNKSKLFIQKYYNKDFNAIINLVDQIEKNKNK